MKADALAADRPWLARPAARVRAQARWGPGVGGRV